MVQLYFLSILCNGLCGYILFSGSDEQDIEKTRLSLNNPTIHLALGILSIVTGFLKLLSPVPLKLRVIIEETLLIQEKTTFFFGDFLPAAAGIIAGFVLIFGIYRQDTYAMTESQKSLDKFAAFLMKFRKPVGLIILAIAVLHFIFPESLFL